MLYVGSDWKLKVIPEDRAREAANNHDNQQDNKESNRVAAKTTTVAASPPDSVADPMTVLVALGGAALFVASFGVRASVNSRRVSVHLMDVAWRHQL